MEADNLVYQFSYGDGPKNETGLCYSTQVVYFNLMSTNNDLYGREHTSLDGHWSVTIFDFMVFLYGSLIYCAFSLAFNKILTLPYVYIMFPATTAVRNVARRVIWSIFVMELRFCKNDSLNQTKRENHQQQLGSIKYLFCYLRF